MPDPTATAPQSLDAVREAVLDAALMHVVFDGWSEATLRAAIRDSDVDAGLARAAFPRGPVDLALAFHARGDRAMLRELRATDMTSMRLRDKVASAVRFRLEAVEDKEAVRRGTTFFALPQHAADGARALWGTADKIWDTLGDRAEDYNWYTKRATLSGVYAATVLYWLGDESEGHAATWDFLDRRIADVMTFEKAKAQAEENPLLRTVFAGPAWLLSQIKAPPRGTDQDLPGSWRMGSGAADTSPPS